MPALAHPGGDNVAWASAPIKRNIYHITHVENLASTVGKRGACLGRDHDSRARAACRRGNEASIKATRVTYLSVSRRERVGQYVPFYSARGPSCSTSCIGQHPSLEYRGGQTSGPP